MTAAIAGPSPRRLARVAGGLYLYIIAAGLFAEGVVRSGLVVSGDPVATAAKLLAGEGLYRLGLAAELVMLCCDIGVAVILYLLLSPAGRVLALAAMAFRLVMVAVSGANALNHLAPLVLLGTPLHAAALGEQAVQAQAYLALQMHAQGYSVSLVFFGLHCVLIGLLLWRSRLLPRAIGALLAVAGAAYLLNSFARVLAPAFAGVLFPWVLLPPLVAELALALWLLVRGVEVAGERPA